MNDGWARALLRRWLAVPVVIRLCVPCAIMGTLWWLSSRSPSDRPGSPLRALLHNGMHVIAYGSLAGSWLLTLVRVDAGSVSIARAATASFVLAVAYGVVDELHQSYVPDRTCSFADLLTDAAGAVLALMVLRPGLGAGTLCWWRLLVAVAICLGCVAFATWGPW